MKNRLFILENKIFQKISKDLKKSEYTLKIENYNCNLQKDVKNQVLETWNKFEKLNPKIAKNDIVYYYKSFDKDKNCDYIYPERFQYVQAFGKTPKFEKYSCEAISNNLIALSSLCLIITKDEKLVLGLKKNMDNKISGFSGYLKEKFNKNGYVDIYSYLISTLNNELNLEESVIESITRIGQNFCPEIMDINKRLNNRVYNNNYLINLKIDSITLKKIFVQNFQFKELKFIPLDKIELKKFLFENEENLSTHCIGALLNLYSIFFKENIIAEEFKVTKIYSNCSKNGKQNLIEWVKNTKAFKWGLVGNSKIKHYSVAPYMWKALFKEIQYPVNYFVLSDDESNNIEYKLKEYISSRKLIGCNIAMPWKNLGFSLCNKIDENIKNFQAINTLVINNNEIQGFNSDGIGLTEVLKKIDILENKKVIIMGAGGACETLPKYLLENYVEKIYICDLESFKSIRLKKLYDPNNIGKIEIISHSELQNIFPKVDIFINATPCGMDGYSEKFPFNEELISFLKKGSKLIEMIYNPYYTPLLKKAKEESYEVYSGIEMLVEQAAISFYHGFGRVLTGYEKNIMRGAAKAALKKNEDHINNRGIRFYREIFG